MKRGLWTFEFAPLVLSALLVGGTIPAARAHQQPQQPDNTKTNKRDRDNGAPTADKQGNSPADIELTKRIRKSITDDKSLSTYAHNIKVITQSGKVTLKGPVRSEEEKITIAAKAVAIAGDGNVDNQLEVTQPKQP